MEQGHLHHASVGVDPSIAGGAVGGGERFPQWSVQETGDFLMIRAELDTTFMETKRNKLLWEVISRKMKERGYNRSAEQCKAKWKNLVTRYKGCETVEDDTMRQQFPFYNDLDAIFTARMQRMLWTEAEGSKKRSAMQFSSDDDDESDLEKSKKKKVAIKSTTNIGSSASNMMIKEIMGEFMKQQMQIEKQWMKAFEEKEEERRLKEMEWRQKMEALEKERMMLDQRWREREEHRMMNEEIRSQKRDALISALFNMLKRQDL